MNRVTRVAALWAAIPIAIMASSASANIRVSPMSVVLEPSGSHTSSSVQVTNVTDRPLRIESRTERRLADDVGAMTSELDEDNFLIFPPQAVIPPGGTQVMRIEWLGEPALSQSESYYAYLSTIPGAPQGGAGIGLRYQFGVSIHVIPPDSTPQLSVASARAVEAGGEPALLIAIRNDGNRIARATDHQLKATYRGADGKTVELSARDMREALGTAVVLPQSSRVFTVPLASAPAAGAEVTVQIDPRP